MSKYRIYELAKDFNTTSKVVIDILARNNIEAKNHMSCVDDDARSIVERTFARKADVPAAAKPITSRSNDDAGQNSNRQNSGQKPMPRYQQPTRPVGQPAAQHRGPAPTGAQSQGQAAQPPRQPQTNRQPNQQSTQQQRRPYNQQQGQQGQIRPAGQYQANSLSTFHR